MRGRPNPWLIIALGLIPSGMAIGAAILAYERRISTMESKLDDARTSAAEHERADAINNHNVWWAISKNHGDPLP